MPDFIRAGGFNMHLLTVAGIISLAVVVRALAAPTAAKLALLRTLPSFLTVLGLFGLATGMRAVGNFFESSRYAALVAAGQKPIELGFVGAGESFCNVAYASFFALVVIIARMVVERRLAQDGGTK